MKNLGIFGGTFNPPHKSHLRIAKCFIQQLNLDKCFFVPSFVSPFKSSESSGNAIDKKHILNMLELLLKNTQKIEISKYEIEKEGVSYSIETVKHFKKLYPQSNLFLLIGVDNLKKFDKWKDYKEILAAVKLAVAPRIFEDNDFNFLFEKERKSTALEKHCYNGIEFYLLQSEAKEYSSSDVRKLISEGKAVSDYLIEEVEDYIYKNKLYLA